MKKQWFIILGFSILLIQGCIPSLHPFYSEKDLVKDNRLAGTWYGSGEGMSNSGHSVWEFVDTKHEHYHLNYTFEQKSGQFDASLFVLDGQHYLDIFPTEHNNMNLLQSLTTFPGHLLVKIEFGEKGINIQYMDSEYLESLFKNHQIRLKHEQNAEGNILLTASTNELRQFLIKYGKDENFFTEADLLAKEISTE